MTRTVAWSRWAALSGLGLLVMGALGADLVSAVAGFSYQEVDSEAALRPMGTLSVPLATPASGTAVRMPLLDVDQDGVLQCQEGPGGWTVPEWNLTQHTAQRLWDQWFILERTGDGVLLADWEVAVGPVVLNGSAALGEQVVGGAMDRDRDGRVSHDEVVVALAPLSADGNEVRAGCADGVVSSNELPIAPEPRSHLLGTDALGRDLLVRLFYGLRVSLLVGFGALLVALLLGGSIGIAAGYLGGWVDGLVLRSVEAAQAIPFLVLVILASMLSRHLFLGQPASESALPQAMVLMAALGAVQWFSLARFARGQAASLRHAAHITAVRTMGFPTWRILGWHLLPALRLPLASFAALLLPSLVLEEAFLSFLGLGVQPPYPSLGTLLADGISWQDAHPRLLLAPGLLLGLLTLCLFVLSDALGHESPVKRRVP